jgi:hypothetical protein
MRSRAKRVGLVVAAMTMIFGTATRVDADMIISNLVGDDHGVNLIMEPIPLRSKAVGFTMPSGVAYSLDSVVMRLVSDSTANQVGVVLEGSTGGLPTGVPLVGFNVPAVSDGMPQSYTLTPDSVFQLEPSTTYFIVLYGISGPGQFAWFGNSTNIIPTGVATFAGFYADNSGAASLAPTQPATVLNSFAVNATPSPVPEPTSLALLGLGSLGLLGYRRCHRSARATA